MFMFFTPIFLYYRPSTDILPSKGKLDVSTYLMVSITMQHVITFSIKTARYMILIQKKGLKIFKKNVNIIPKVPYMTFG